MKNIFFILFLLIAENAFSQYDIKVNRVDSITYEKQKQEILSNHPELNDSIIDFLADWKKEWGTDYNPKRNDIYARSIVSDFFYSETEEGYIIDSYTFFEIVFLIGVPDALSFAYDGIFDVVYYYPEDYEIKYCLEHQECNPQECGRQMDIQFDYNGNAIGAGWNF